MRALTATQLSRTNLTSQVLSKQYRDLSLMVHVRQTPPAPIRGSMMRLDFHDQGVWINTVGEMGRDGTAPLKADEKSGVRLFALL